MQANDHGQPHEDQVGISEESPFFRTICEAVAYAHGQGVVHRDLKPDNIFLKNDGTPIVGDFGLCYFEETGERFTLLEEAVGPRWYIAPELESGRVESVHPSSDVYSLGKILYWMLAARIFAREQHRDEKYDLTRNESDLEALTKPGALPILPGLPRGFVRAS